MSVIRFLPVLLFFILFVSFFYIFFYQRGTEVPIISFQNTIQEKECEEGEIATCVKDGCDGTMECINGKFSSCSIEKICVPGSKIGCAMDSCTTGYKTCNECGTGYGECIID